MGGSFSYKVLSTEGWGDRRWLGLKCTRVGGKGCFKKFEEFGIAAEKKGVDFL